jgi:hypothetical protein
VCASCAGTLIGAVDCPGISLPMWVWVVIIVAAVLLSVAVWRWYTVKRDNEDLLLEMKELNDPQYQEPLLSVVPQPLQKAAVLDLGGLVVDLVMIGRGAFGT